MKKKKRIFIFLIIFFGVLFFSKTSSAATYYVSSNSTSTNWSACQNINISCTPQTAMQNAVAGDTVYFRGGQGGNYDIVGCNWTVPTLRPTNAGTEGNPITFMNYPGEVPTLRNVGVSETWGHCLDYIIGTYNPAGGNNYITWDGFKLGVTGDINIEGKPGILMHTGTGIIVRNIDIIWPVVVTDAGGNPKNYAAIGITDCDDCLVQNVRIQGGGGGQSNCINIYRTTNLIVEKSSFYKHQVYCKDGCVGPIIRYNFFYGTETGDKAVGMAAAGGTPFDSPQIYQNICANSDGGTFLRNDHSQAEGGVELIYNNTIYRCGHPTDSINSRMIYPAYDNDHRIFNNVIVGGSGQRMYVASGNNPGEPTYMDYNIYYGLNPSGNNWTTHLYGSGTVGYNTLPAWQASGALVGGGNPDTHSYEVDPLFANAGGSSPKDYKISTTLKNSGRGGIWPSVIGAYITGDETIGYTPSAQPDTTPPAAPTGVVVQ